MSYQTDGDLIIDPTLDDAEEPLLSSDEFESTSEQDAELADPKRWLDLFVKTITSTKSLILIFLVIVGTLNRVYFRLMLVAAPYPFFLNMWTSFIYMPVFFTVILIIDRTTKEITPEMRAFPKKKFLLVLYRLPLYLFLDGFP